MTGLGIDGAFTLAVNVTKTITTDCADCRLVVECRLRAKCRLQMADFLNVLFAFYTDRLPSCIIEYALFTLERLILKLRLNVLIFVFCDLRLIMFLKMFFNLHGLQYFNKSITSIIEYYNSKAERI